MKAMRLVPGQVVNPFFSHDAKRTARERGETYDVTPFFVEPIGTVVEDSDCWKLCLGDRPVLKPADAECRAKVLEAMGNETRQKFLRNLARQNKPEVRKQMGKSQIEWLDSMMETYGTEVENLDRSPVEQLELPPSEAVTQEAVVVAAEPPVATVAAVPEAVETEADADAEVDET